MARGPRQPTIANEKTLFVALRFLNGNHFYSRFSSLEGQKNPHKGEGKGKRRKKRNKMNA